MAQQMDTDSMQLLINAVAQYRQALAQNYQIILNAANACDAAMGSDDISKKHISKLNTALAELQKTAMIAESVQTSLTADLRRALDVNN